MKESLYRRLPLLSNRLRLEAFEERWTLGGAGFLNASVTSIGVATALFRTTESSGTSTDSTRITVNPAGLSISSDRQLERLTPTTFIRAASLDQESGIPATLAGKATDEVTNARRLDLLDGASADAIFGTPDDFDLLGTPPAKFPDQVKPPSGLASMGDAGAGNFAQGNYLGTNAVGRNSGSEVNQARASGTTDGDSLDAAIARSSSSISDGGFAANSGNIFRVNGGFHAVPVTDAMIDRGIANADVPRITAQNRNAPSMMGGWNPALRSIMVMDDGSHWFAAESGTDVSVNSTMIYYRLGEDGWKEAGSVVLPAGIQQNMASVTDGRTIYSYGIARSTVVETWFNTDKPGWNLSTGNSLTASGSVIRPGSASNYVGAAWHNNTRVVWWTTVGANGAGGSWSYSFNQGGGWKNPVVSGLGGFNDVGYVRAQFDDQSQLRMVGESYRGRYPFGEKYLFATTLTLGKQATWAPVLQQTAFTPMDIWQEGSGSSQYLYRTRTDQIGYSFGSGSAARSITFAALDGRFVADKDRLGLVLGYGNFLEVRVVKRSEATGFIDWNAIVPIKIGFPESLGKAGLSAIWNVDHSKQPNDSNQLEFAIAGAYPSYDHLVYYYTMK